MEQNNQPIQNNSVLYIILGILQLMCCNQITGIMTIIFSALANTDYVNGNIKEYLNKIKTARIASIIGVALGIIFFILLFVFYGFIILAALLES